MKLYEEHSFSTNNNNNLTVVLKRFIMFILNESE